MNKILFLTCLVIMSNYSAVSSDQFSESEELKKIKQKQDTFKDKYFPFEEDNSWFSYSYEKRRKPSAHYVNITDIEDLCSYVVKEATLLSDRRKELRDQCQNLTSEIEKLKGDLEEKQKRFISSEEDIKIEQDKSKDLQCKIDFLNNDLDILKCRYDELKKINEHLKISNDNLDKEKKIIESKLYCSEQELNNYEKILTNGQKNLNSYLKREEKRRDEQITKIFQTKQTNLITFNRKNFAGDKIIEDQGVYISLEKEQEYLSHLYQIIRRANINLSEKPKSLVQALEIIVQKNLDD